MSPELEVAICGCSLWWTSVKAMPDNALGDLILLSGVVLTFLGTGGVVWGMFG